ncbi:MAG: dioxygenase family protein [bacterium]
MQSKNRRTFIKGSLLGGAAALLSKPALSAHPTPPEAEGPFYPVMAQKDRDFDLTHVDGQSGVAQGQAVWIEGRVIDTDGNPVEDATVDLWQANAAGKYRHPHDNSTAPLDPNFQGWAIVQSGKNGSFKVKTIIPGAYPVSNSWTRPPHIHFKISRRGYEELTTQMYFPDQPLNDVDRLLQRKDKTEQQSMIATQVDGKADTLAYQIVLKKV